MIKMGQIKISENKQMTKTNSNIQIEGVIIYGKNKYRAVTFRK